METGTWWIRPQVPHGSISAWSQAGISFDEDVRHLNRSVACDLENRLIYGQPRTVPRLGDPTPLRAEIASYSLVNGEDLTWIRLPEDDFYAGGMTIPGGRLLLATKSAQHF